VETPIPTVGQGSQDLLRRGRQGSMALAVESEILLRARPDQEVPPVQADQEVQPGREVPLFPEDPPPLFRRARLLLPEGLRVQPDLPGPLLLWRQPGRLHLGRPPVRPRPAGRFP
jgi:hypothetical protein